MNASNPIRVLLVDDSALVRSMFKRVLSAANDIEVVGGARDPFEARELIISHRPHVIILDIEMPRMDGLTFLKKLQAHYPVPVIICSGVTPSNGQLALDAIAAGAIDVVCKPQEGGGQALRLLGAEIAEKIRAAASTGGKKKRQHRASSQADTLASVRVDPGSHLVAIGASTGGTEAILALLSNAPADFPPTVIVQHMPEAFTRSFADRLNRCCNLRVSEAVDGESVSPGQVLVARGGIQMRVRRAGKRFNIAYGEREPVNLHCPSVDVLFDSVAEQARDRAVGVILTGMGADGARGLLRMRNAGAVTFGQDADSCIVYGMPKAANELGAIDCSAQPGEIPTLIVRALQGSVASGR